MAHISVRDLVLMCDFGDRRGARMNEIINPIEAAWNSTDATWSMAIVGVDPDPTMAPVLKKWAQDY